MGIKIVADSCCDTNEAIDGVVEIKRVPLTIYVGEKEFPDDGTYSSRDILRMMRESETSPRTASPSPGQFLEGIEDGDEDRVFIVTLPAQLSSTYQNAVMAQRMAREKGTAKFVHVFDSLSASVGEALVCLKIHELSTQGIKAAELVERVNEYISDMKTFFLLDSLDNLVKAGRMSKLMGRIGSVLSLKLILGASDEGTIKLFDKARGAKRAFRRLIDQIEEHGERLEERILGVAHCNCREKAEELKAEVLKRFNFKDVIIVETKGISTVYADDGGLIIAF